jgi:hypothetical protein
MRLSVNLGVVFLFVLTLTAWGYELAYDDGEPEFMYTWEGYSIGEDFLGAFAMRMTANSYPAELYSVMFGFTRVEISPDTSSWNYFILGHDATTDNPDETKVLYESPDISAADMDILVWPSFTWYQYDIPVYSPIEVTDDWWVVCHGNWFGAGANWYICVDETDGGVGRDRTKNMSGWHPTEYIPAWNGGDLLIRSVVDEPSIAVDAASFGRIKALFE